MRGSAAGKPSTAPFSTMTLLSMNFLSEAPSSGLGCTGNLPALYYVTRSPASLFFD